MADIKQAAKWMSEGKKVRRLAWHSSVMLRGELWISLLIEHKKVPATFECFDLLADDWEIAE